MEKNLYRSIGEKRVRESVGLFYEDFEKGMDAWEAPGTGAVGWRLLEANTCGGRYTMLLGQDGQTPFADGNGEFFLQLKQPLDLKAGVKPVPRYSRCATDRAAEVG